MPDRVNHPNNLVLVVVRQPSVAGFGIDDAFVPGHTEHDIDPGAHTNDVAVHGHRNR